MGRELESNGGTDEVFVFFVWGLRGAAQEKKQKR